VLTQNIEKGGVMAEQKKSTFGQGEEVEPEAEIPVPEPEPEQKPKIDWESIAKYKAAEFENYIKRQKDSVSNAFNDGRGKVLMEFLPFGDNLAEAIKMIPGADERKGVEILLRKFNSIIENIGVEVLTVKAGDTFDPYIHQSINAGATGDNTVKEVLANGYKFAGRILRPAVVRI